jgi:prophage maintenance system killer protein
MKKIKQKINTPVIYQAKNGAIQLRGDFEKETIWGTQAQIVELFGIDQSVVSKHIKNIFKDKELDEKSNMQKMHIANSDKPVVLYSLDILLSVGYRTNSTLAINFRKWASKILKDYMTDGYSINKNRIKENYNKFMFAVNEVKNLLPKESFADTKNMLDLVAVFANTWMSLDSYDKGEFQVKKTTKKSVSLTAKDLNANLQKLKMNLMQKGEATDMFASDRSINSLEGIIGNVMQSFAGEFVYKSAEEKAVHLFYFIIKNHPFLDGNKRSGAFAFVWFLEKNKILDLGKISPEALTALTILVAESKPEEKDRIVKLLILLISKK